MTIRELQKRVGDFSREHHLDSNPEYKILDTVSELGEVSKEILKMTDYGKKSMVFKDEVGLELGDLLYSVVTIANSLNVDLEEAVENALKKYGERLKKGSPGSEND